jgi:hypothetical protein
MALGFPLRPHSQVIENTGVMPIAQGCRRVAPRDEVRSKSGAEHGWPEVKSVVGRTIFRTGMGVDLQTSNDDE